MIDETLIVACIAQKTTAQKKLYDALAPKMLAVCLRYVKNRADAEDILIEGMMKIFKNIDQFSGEGNFEAWSRRIFVNESLMFLRKKKLLIISLDDSPTNVFNVATPSTAEGDLMIEEIYKILAVLPVGYCTVFNLYELDGYKHIEIAELLGISINTSKSQLILAKKRIRIEFEKIYGNR